MQICKMASRDFEISTKRGCNYLATKRTETTASINTPSRHQRATRFIVWYIIVIMMTVTVTETGAKPATQRHMLKHISDEIHRPRQITKRSHGSGNSPDDWNNPCGGTFDASKPSPRMDKDNALHFLRRAARIAHRTLTTNDKQNIDIKDFSTWDKHKHNYKFIPKLTRNSTALKRWYRNVQTYVAGFSYLHHVQQANEHKSQNGNGISTELQQLMDQARVVLCEIESTINRTSVGTNIKFRPVSQIEMDKRLKFATRIKSKGKEPLMVDEVDLKYMKHYFIDFLSTMINILRKDPNKANRSLGLDSSSSSVSSDEVMNSSRKGPAGKKRRPAIGKKAQNKKAKRGRVAKNNSLSAAAA